MATRPQIKLAAALTLAAMLPFAAQAQDKKETPARDDSAVYLSMGPQYPATIHTRTQAFDYRQANQRVKTFYLTNAANPNDGNELLTGLRLMMDPSIKIYLIPEQNAIVVQALPYELNQVETWLHEWDRPKKPFRLTYTITESDSGKRIGVQHFSVTVVAGQRTTLKNGSKVPVVTGSGSNPQFTYIDVGVDIDATLIETASGGQLKSKIEQSSVGEDRQAGGLQEPVIRQNVLEGIVQLVTGRPMAVGAIDISGSTRHLDVEVTMDPIK